jgi:hypothetical protein
MNSFTWWVDKGTCIASYLHNFLQCALAHIDALIYGGSYKSSNSSQFYVPFPQYFFYIPHLMPTVGAFIANWTMVILEQ